ncbi:hypothetical protein BD626DRAFT_524768 [Schizophyllum amplum]|uniref:Uncharacterized protein n=1 Tax=Schizophyllum amplum TaxID=97359 RepID=A0A550BSP7_9AGAR|nr:hypothetical protein BD626DRAFT_524768 [Auriculariopsis ampla]
MFYLRYCVRVVPVSPSRNLVRSRSLPVPRPAPFDLRFAATLPFDPSRLSIVPVTRP